MLLRFLTSVVELSSSRPRITLLLALAALGLSIAALSRLRIDSTLSGMLGGDNPAAEALARITDDFHAAEDLLVLASAPASLPVPHAEQLLLEYAARLASAAREPAAVTAGITGVRYLPDPSIESYFREVVLPAGALWLDDESFDALLHRLEPDEVRAQLAQNATMLAAPGPGAASLAKQLVKDPLRLREFFLARFARSFADAPRADFSDDRHALLIRISGARPVNDIEFAKRFTAAVQHLADQTNTGALDIRIGGGYAIASASATTIRRDAISSTIGSGVLVYLFLALAYRRFSAPITIMFTAGIGIVVAFGCYALFIHTITPLTTVVAALLAGLGVEYAIHFRSHHDLIASAGASSTQASVRAARELAAPLIAVCLTSVFGFGAIDVSGVRMLKDFATLGCIGLVGALLAAWLVLPAILALLPLPTNTTKPRRDGGFPGMLVALVTNHSARSLGAGAILAVAALVVVATTPGWVPPFESETSVLHPQPSAPLETERIIRQRFRSLGESLFVRIVGDSADDLATRSHQVTDRLSTPEARRAGVSATLGLASLVPDPRRVPHRLGQLNALDAQATGTRIIEEFERSEFDPAAFQDYFEFLRKLLTNRHVPGVTDVLQRPDIARQLLPAASVDNPAILPHQTIMLVTAANAPSERSAQASLIKNIRSLIDDVPGATLTGLIVVSHDLETAARRDAVYFGLLSITLVIAWLFLFLRRPIDVALAFVPVVFSVVSVLAIMSTLGLRLNPVNIVALPLLAGIAVDSGIYLVAAARRSTNGPHPAAELRHTLRPTVHAIMSTTGATALGFGTLLWTHTPAVRSMGLAMLVGVISSLTACLLILVPILMWRASRSERSPK